jgi:hypothetical protein
MSYNEKLLYRMKGFTNAILRYPVTAIFLITIAILNGYNINQESDKNQRLIVTLLVGAFLGVVGQILYERFFREKKNIRLVLIGITVLLSAGYFIIIRQSPTIGMALSIRTGVALFALLITFIWIPSIKNRISFNESFMIAFKAFFISLFFSGVIFAGISIIIATTNQLLFDVDYRANAHALNIIFVLFAPMYFLSLIPVFPIINNEMNKNQEENETTGKDQAADKIIKLGECPKFLEILLSFILIPLISVFTLILLLYILINIGEGFWSDNLLEQMIVAYSITVIVIYILVSRLNNKFAGFYRKLFPKILVPLVVIQTISSILRIGELGLTHGRYYVILYGVFAAITGVLFSFLPVKKNGIVAILLLGFSVFSIMPPVDAFTISRVSQLNMLEDILENNNMLSGNQMEANTKIQEKDKEKIIEIMNYMNNMGYVETISWLPEDFEFYNDFETAFGFEPYIYDSGETPQYVYLSLPENTPVDISGYDYFIPTGIYSNQSKTEDVFANFEIEGKTYSILKKYSGNQINIIIKDENDGQILGMDASEMFGRYTEEYNKKDILSLEEATYIKENELAGVKIIIKNLSIENMSTDPYYGAEIILLLEIK